MPSAAGLEPDTFPSIYIAVVRGTTRRGARSFFFPPPTSSSLFARWKINTAIYEKPLSVLNKNEKINEHSNINTPIHFANLLIEEIYISFVLSKTKKERKKKQGRSLKRNN